MTKIILWIGVVVVVLFALRLLNVAKAKRRAGATSASQPPPAEKMIRCSGCGVYLPQKDATQGPKGPTCGEPACLRQH